MADFTELTEFLDNLSQRFGIPGCDCAVTVGGKHVYRHRAGFRDEEAGIPMTGDETWWIYSATKLFTCTAALQLMERGKLELDAPVRRYLPEFAHITVKDGETVRPAKTELTIRHLMTMTGGLDYDLTRPALAKAAAQGGDTRSVVAALAGDPFCFDPGSHFLYSLCHDVLGAVIEVVSGQPLEDYMAEHLFQPLGMTDTTFRPREHHFARMAKQYRHLDIEGHHLPMGQENMFRLTPRYDSGGAGLCTTVDDYIRLATALALGGGGILSEESVKLLKTPQLNDIQLQDYVDRSPAARWYSYGLGVRVLVEELGNTVPLGEFGWDGAAGAYVLVDTQNQVALFYAQQVCNSWITYQRLHPQLRDTLYRCLGN